MTPKEYLQQYQHANDAINAKLDQIHRLRELATKTTQVMTPDPVHESGDQDKVAAIVAKIVDMEAEVDGEIDQLQEIKRKIEAAIAMVPDAAQRKVLTLRYINGLRWEEIAVRLNYTYRHATRLHGEALRVVGYNMSLNVPIDP